MEQFDSSEEASSRVLEQQQRNDEQQCPIVASEHSIVDSGCGEDFSPGIHHVPTRLLYFAPVSKYLLQKVQSVQNDATRQITATRRCESITPVLQKLYWLPVRPRVEFKLVLHAVVVWTDTVVPSFRHSAHCRYWPLSASICV